MLRNVRTFSIFRYLPLSPVQTDKSRNNRVIVCCKINVDAVDDWVSLDTSAIEKRSFSTPYLTCVELHLQQSRKLVQNLK